MSTLALVSSSPRGRSVHIGGALVSQRKRDFRIILPRLGVDLSYSTRTAFELDVGLGVGTPIDFDGEMSPYLARRIATSADRDADRFALIELTPVEAERLAGAIAEATPASFGPALPILPAYEPRNGLLVPIATIRKHLTHHDVQTEKGQVLSPPLRRSAPVAFDLIKQAADDAENVIAEVILFEVARDQGWCKRLDHIKGNKPPRAKSLTESEIDAVAKAYAAEITRRKARNAAA